ncbi:MAG: hypothetical protein HC902_11515 [Calothrix sp. SM1_5_4]|nr:hypothetical protein [Calothrix sp. SM1_5_4]
MLEIRRDLHTFKGSAALFHFTALAQRLHEAEEALSGRDQARAVAFDLLDFYEGWRLAERDLLNLLNKAAESGWGPGRSLKAYLEGFGETVARVAKRLGKKVIFEVSSSLPEDRPLIRPVPEVLRALVHLFNNAVDHGIEDPDGRHKAGKPQSGRVRVEMSSLEKSGRAFVRILILDDGAGIDVGALRTALGPHGAGLNETELFQHIFDERVSTRRDGISEISGRGIGLNALKAAVLRAGGSVRVIRSDGRGTEVEILLPGDALFLSVTPFTAAA